MSFARFKTIIFAAGFLVTVIACNNSDVTAPGGDPGTVAAAGTLKYTLDGTTYTVPAKYTGELNREVGAYAVYLSANQTLSIDGIIEANQREIYLVTIGLSEPATLNIGGNSSGTTKTFFPASLTYQDDLGDWPGRQYHSTSTFTGTTTLTKFDLTGKLTSGTFSGNLTQYFPNGVTGSVSITNGSFTDLPIQ